MSVLLSAVLPALLEVLLVPFFVSREEGCCSKWLLWLLEASTYNYQLERSLRRLPPPKDAEGNDRILDLDETAQKLVERGFSQLISTLLLALTLGVAAPLVGLAAAMAAVLQLVHAANPGKSDLEPPK